jgi:hypothetical protein
MNFSPGFIEGLITIVITAVLIPVVFRFIDDRRARQQRETDDLKQRKQKEFEAELSRQSKVIESQVQFIEKLSDLLWEFQLTAIAVSYYHQFGLGDQYQQASKNYLDNAGKFLGKIRAEISKSLRLSSHNTYEAWKNLYYGKLLKLDLELTRLIEHPDRSGQIQGSTWQSVNQYAVHGLSEEVDNVINSLALEFGLKGKASVDTINRIADTGSNANHTQLPSTKGM